MIFKAPLQIPTVAATQSNHLCHIRDNSNLNDMIEERLLSDQAIAAGVIGDVVVYLGVHSKVDARPDHPVRVVLVETTPHVKTGGRKGGTVGPPSDGIIPIATNLLDVPDEIYRQRWAVELFFRFFKHWLGDKHLMSHDPTGIQFQAYVAIIACMLIHLWTGRRPNIRTCEMVFHYLTGWATLDAMTTHLEKVQNAKKPA